MKKTAAVAALVLAFAVSGCAETAADRAEEACAEFAPEAIARHYLQCADG